MRSVRVGVPANVVALNYCLLCKLQIFCLGLFWQRIEDLVRMSYYFPNVFLLFICFGALMFNF